MTHIIVATHGKFSEEIVNSAAMVYGEDENCHVVTFLPGEGGEHLIEKYNAIIATLPENEPVLFLVDLFGGSPYNAACRVAMENDKCGIVTGVSLPMLVEVINYRLCNGENANVQDAMEKAVEASVSGAQKFHKSQVESETDDEGDDL